MINNLRPVEILLMEDNEGDVFLTKRAFQKGKIANNIQVAPDGEVGLEMLRRKGEYKDLPTPDIVFLDMNMPKKDGAQVLMEMKSDDILRRIPVVVLTSSKAERDILKTYDLHANAYIVKPIDCEKFHETVAAIEGFWFSVVVLPSEAETKE